MKKIYTEISAGEIVDKLTILQIKKKKISNRQSLILIRKEYNSLFNVLKKNIKFTLKIKRLWRELLKVNSNIWEMENYKREAQKHLEKLTKTAIEVYRNNDKRAVLKQKINKITKSNIQEVKNYSKY